MTSQPNPYVGPRAFEPGDPFFGRTREIRQLKSLLIAERLVLMHSPSGAGKTSLIQAGLLPEMRRERFNVLPVMRVGLEPPEELPRGSANRYLLSAVHFLEGGLPEGEQLQLEQLRGLTLDAYLNQRPRAADAAQSDLLVFDQFEEVLTAAPNDQASKQAFFAQLGSALSSPNRWALFAIREDFLGALTPYLASLPNRLDCRFRLDLLGREAAVQVIRKPAALAAVEVTDRAASQLADDLSSIQVQQPDGRLVKEKGAYVEPVQLQVVCYRLWQSLNEGDTSIDLDALERVGDVDQSLGDYYQAAVKQAVERGGVTEREVREWFENKLIFPGGIRGQALMGAEESEGLSNRAIQQLIDAHIVRGEKHGAVTWYELAHDRLIRPIQNSNAAWFSQHLALFQRQARLWEDERRPEGLLLRGWELSEGELWAEAHAAELEDHEREFLAACQRARGLEQARVRANQRIRILLMIAIAYGLVAIVLGLLAYRSSLESKAVSLAMVSKQALADGDPNTAAMLALQAARAPYPYTRQAEEALSGIARIYQPRTALPLLARDGVRLAAFSPDGAGIITANQDNSLSLRDAKTGRELKTFRGHSAGINDIRFSPDGQKMASASDDGTARVWDLASGKQTAVLYEPGPLLSVAFSADGARLLAVTSETTQVWDLATEEAVFRPTRHLFRTSSGTLSADGRFGATGDAGGTVYIWSAVNGADLVQFGISSNAKVSALAFSPDGSRLLIAGADSTPGIWDPATGKQLIQLKGHTGNISAGAYDRSGARVATASADHTVRIWDAASGRLLLTLTEFSDPVTGVSFSPDGKELVTASLDGTLKIFDAVAGTALFGFPEKSQLAGHAAMVNALALSSDGQRVLTASDDGSLLLWDSTAGKQAARLVGHAERVTCVRFSPDGQRAISGSANHTVIVWDVASRQVLRRLAGAGGQILNVSLSADGARAAAVNDDRMLYVWDVASGAQIFKIHTHKADYFDDAAFTPGASQVITIERYMLHVWDGNTGQEVASLEASLPWADQFSQQYIPGILQVSPDGKKAGALIYAPSGTVAQIWDLGSHTVLASLKMPTGSLGLAFSPQLDWAFSGDGKGIYAWNLALENSFFLGSTAGTPRMLATLPAGQGDLLIAWLYHNSAELTVGLFQPAPARELIAYKAIRQAHWWAAAPLPLPGLVHSLCGDCAPTAPQRLQFQLYTFGMWVNQNHRVIMFTLLGLVYAVLLVVSAAALTRRIAPDQGRSTAAATAGQRFPAGQYACAILLGGLPLLIILIAIMASFTSILDREVNLSSFDLDKLMIAIFQVPNNLLYALPLLFWPGLMTSYLITALPPRRKGQPGRARLGAFAGAASAAVSALMMDLYLMMVVYSLGERGRSLIPPTAMLIFIFVSMLIAAAFGYFLSGIAAGFYIRTVEPWISAAQGRRSDLRSS